MNLALACATRPLVCVNCARDSGNRCRSCLLFRQFSWGGGGRSLLLTLAAALIAIATMTLITDAQTLDDGSEQADPLQGRIIARVQDRTANGVDDYRIEFGFLPEWALAQRDSVDRVVRTWSGWLPSARFVTKRALNQCAANNDRRWLKSSLITVPRAGLRRQWDRDRWPRHRSLQPRFARPFAR